MAALKALGEFAARWDPSIAVDDSRLIFTGHSNGGFGAWFFGSHYPDLALGIAPLSGMATLGTTMLHRPAGFTDRLWRVLDDSVGEYRNHDLASNILGIPFLARTGALDRTIDPRSTISMVKLFEDAGAKFNFSKDGRGGARWQGESAAVIVLGGKDC